MHDSETDATLPVHVPVEEPHPTILPTQGERVLLLYPSIYDIRLPWPRWQQPATLLKLGTYCRRVGADVKLVDMINHPRGKVLQRHKISTLDLDGQPVNKWRFGISRTALVEQLRTWERAGWQPDRVYIECFTTFWWEGAAEATSCVRQCFANAQIILLGAYAQLAPEHAIACAEADALFAAAPDIAVLPIDLSLYSEAPNFVSLSLGEGGRTAEDILEEVSIFADRWSVKHFAFTDHAVARRFPELYTDVLERLAASGLRIRFYALGNIAPSDLIEHPHLPSLLKRSRYARIYLADDRDIALDQAAANSLIDEYRCSTLLCHDAGFPKRTQVLSAGICLGRAGEDLAARSMLITWAAHHTGSVVLWPYQPAPHECPEVPLEEQNGKLFPFRRQNEYQYRDYLNVMGLATVLNSKYRTHTFDFLGDGVIPKFFRESIARKAWEPDPEVKGSAKLPMVIRQQNSIERTGT